MVIHLNIYKNYLSPKVVIEPSIAPVKSVLNYAKDNPDAKVYWILGARDGDEGDLADIELALTTLKNAGATEILVLKCTTAYPAPAEESNLLTISDMVTRFNVLSGLSDHSIGTAAAIAAVALGGSLIEKHFTLDGEEETVDSFFPQLN